MEQGIIFFQSTDIEGYTKSTHGLFELFASNLDGLANVNIFEQIQVVVPNQAFAIWLRDKITLKSGICANLDFVVLLGPVLTKLFLDNNSAARIFDFKQAKYIIYKYLCTTRLQSNDAKEINDYIYKNGILDKLRVYQLSLQLQQIFQEYIYLRTRELIDLNKSNLPKWQKQILTHLFAQIGRDKTFLDVYKYFSNLDLDRTDLILPKRLFIFGLTSVYRAQLEIIKKIASKIDVYWYYKTPSFEYYADLLSLKARNKLEKKFFKYPDLNLDDLYLTDGNPLLANLGQQSREFIELLYANDIQVYNFATKTVHDKIRKNENGNESGNLVKNPATFLSVLQDDIKNIKYRVCRDLRLNKDNQFYSDPIRIVSANNKEIYDMVNNTTSIKVNVCHNRMREVQVMFNEVVSILDKNPGTRLDEILITAPDIDDYASYIKAVFANEFVQRKDGTKHKIQFNITGDRCYSDAKILEAIKTVINSPYDLPVSYLLEILAQLQRNLDINSTDIDLIKKWLLENKTYFGFSADDYAIYGYQNYATHSFKQFLNNLVLGACLTDEILLNDKGTLLYHVSNGDHDLVTTPGLTSKLSPYDNLDNSQIALCNKLINLIEILEKIRQVFYVTANDYRELTVDELHKTLLMLQDYLICDDESLLVSNKLLGDLLKIDTIHGSSMLITLPIFNLILDEYIGEFKNTVNLNGALTCASMQYMRNIPYKYIYILGLNFTEFPRNYTPNQLSILSREWYLADRNYNIEDKQTFLDMILAVKEQLFLSYVGYKETDNTEIKPSPILSLLLTTITQSFTDFWQSDNGIEYSYKNIVVDQALHPFYNNLQNNFSEFWHNIRAVVADEMLDQHWDLHTTYKIKLSPKQMEYCYNSNVTQIVNSFLYTNNNFYRTIGVNSYLDNNLLPEVEGFKLHDRDLARTIYYYLDRYNSKIASEELCEYLIAKGIIGYDHIGKYQFNYYYDLYQTYIKKRGEYLVEISLNYPLGDRDINIQDQIYLENDKVIVTDSFANITKNKLAKSIHELPYHLKLRGIIFYLLLHNGAKVSNHLVGDDTNLVTNTNIRQIVLRQINLEREFCDYNIEVKDKNLLKKILSYYLDSFTRPVLIHKAAIEEFAKVINDNYKKKSHVITKEVREQAILKAKNIYLNEYNNYDLEVIKQDLLFAPVASNYFDFIKNSNQDNDIEIVGEILSHLNTNEQN